MYKVFEELGFTAGDKVKCVGKDKHINLYEVGKIYTLKWYDERKGILTNEDGYNGFDGEWELVKEEKQMYKIGDRVKISGIGRDEYENDAWNPWYLSGTVIYSNAERDFCYRVEWDNGKCNSYEKDDLELSIEQKEPEVKRTETLLTETVVKTEVVTKEEKKIKEVTDGYGPGGINISVRDAEHGMIELVIGARRENACAPYVTKGSLSELIEELQAVHDLMQ